MVRHHRATLLEQQPRSNCTGGHFTSPNEQKTQQSPGISSDEDLPHVGQVMIDVSTASTTSPIGVQLQLEGRTDVMFYADRTH
jgi:hypothetical protein